MNNVKKISQAIGALMLAAFVLYGVGSAIATSAAKGSPEMAVGMSMMLLNSVAVIAIGVLMHHPVLTPHTPSVAQAYLATRILEGLLLAIGAIALLMSSPKTNFYAYNAAMLILGIGSVFLCLALYRSKLVPEFVAVWGCVGYTSIVVGSLLELAGIEGASIISAVPGGLFEIYFSLWLLVRGFRSTQSTPTPLVTRT